MRITAVSILSFGLLALCISAFTACSSQTEANIAEIKLPTVQCGTCTNTVSKALKEVDGVVEVDVNLEKKTARVTYMSDRVSVTKLEQTVAKAGYAANSAKADPGAYAKLPGCCKVPETK